MRKKATWGARVAKKATWGARVTNVVFILFVAVLFGTPASLAAEDATSGNPPANVRSRNSKPAPVEQLDFADRKIDRSLRERARTHGNEESDVIVEFTDSKGDDVAKAFGRQGRKLDGMNGRAMRMSNALIRRLAEHGKIKRIMADRPVEGFNGRTAVTVGARAVYQLMGYDGSGIGVAVIDSGIVAWHDDLTVANRQGQRVVHFKDFVNNLPNRYDDWGHGTHVAGIVAGNGYDSNGTREAVAPGANIIALKALNANGSGRISDIIAAIDYAVSVRTTYNIRVINLSLGAGVYESYRTDPLTLACKRAVDAGIVVVAAAGNMGKSLSGQPQYGAIGSPANAPWVLTVGASSSEGTTDRRDDKIAGYSSRGPTMIDFNAKPDLVAPGSGTVSLSAKNSTLYLQKSPYLIGAAWNITGLLGTKPYLTLSGTSMAAPVVAGSVALMLQANPNLTPNMVKAILQFTAQVYPGYNWLTQGAGFLNTRGAVLLAEYFRHGHPGMAYPRMTGWSKHLLWGNYRVRGGVLAPGGTAWATNIVWGDMATPSGAKIVWGENCDNYLTCENDNIVWGNNIVWGDSSEDDNIVWGNTDGDNIVWGNGDGDDNIVWGNGEEDNIVWGNTDEDNIVWGNDCAGANCDNIVWGNADEDNIVWGNAEGIDNIVWGNTSDDNIVWGNSGDDDISWGNSADDSEFVFGDDEADVNSFDITVWDNLFEMAFPDPSSDSPPASPPPSDPPPADPPPTEPPPPGGSGGDSTPMQMGGAL